jgi:hypothetical protein
MRLQAGGLHTNAKPRSPHFLFLKSGDMQVNSQRSSCTIHGVERMAKASLSTKEKATPTRITKVHADRPARSSNNKMHSFILLQKNPFLASSHQPGAVQIRIEESVDGVKNPISELADLIRSCSPVGSEKSSACPELGRDVLVQQRLSPQYCIAL